MPLVNVSNFLINLWMGFLICLDLVSSNGLCKVTFIYDSKGVLNKELLQFCILGEGGGGGGGGKD